MRGAAKISLIVLIVATATVVAIAGTDDSGESMGEYAKRLNRQIELAIFDERNWPQYPGGLAGFLFDQDCVVERGRILFRDTRSSAESENRWLEATISELFDGTWRIVYISSCNKSRAEEAVRKRDHFRQRSHERSGFDYVSQGPLELLALLKTRGSPYWVSPIMPFGWVKERDLPALIDLLDSPEPCANVQSMLSSFIDISRSTIGNEAAYLIEGFRRDWYPPRLNSTRPFCDIEEIKQWWEERQGT